MDTIRNFRCIKHHLQLIRDSSLSILRGCVAHVYIELGLQFLELRQLCRKILCHVRLNVEVVRSKQVGGS